MSRIAKKALTVPKGVDVSINGQTMKVKGAKGAFDMQIHDAVTVTQEDNVLKFAAKSGTDSNAWALAGTTRALANNMVTGVSQGFEKKLQLVGVGYRAQAQGAKLNLSLGYSHPIVTTCLKALLSKRLAKRKLLSVVVTSRKLVKLQQMYVLIVHQSLTKAKV